MCGGRCRMNFPKRITSARHSVCVFSPETFRLRVFAGAMAVAASIALLFVFHPFSPKEETGSFSHVEQAFANLSQEDQAYMLAVYQEDIFMNE